MSEKGNLSAGARELLELGLAAKASEREKAIKDLLAWMDRRDALLLDCSPGEAFNAIRSLLVLARELSGGLWHKAFDGRDSQVLEHLRNIGSGETEKARVWRLDLLADKMRLVSGLVDGQGSYLSAMQLIEEIEAIAAGDEPRLFAPVGSRPSGKKTNAHRLSRKQLRALEWKVVLSARAVSATERDLILASSYGATSDTIRKWDSPCRRHLGAAFVDKKLADAKAGASGPMFGEAAGLAQADAVAWDGKDYQRELRAGVGE